MRRPGRNHTGAFKVKVAVAALLTMGVPTVIIGVLPTYTTIGVAAPLLLAICCFGQGLGLGGE